MKRLLVTAALGISIGAAVLPLSGAFAAYGSEAPDSGPIAGSPPTGASDSSASTASSVSGTAIVQFAMKYLGYPYTATGNSPSTGFSCIGFVSYVYRSNGIDLPGDLGDALTYAPRVAFTDLLPGDILYFQNTVWAGLSHAAIYIGGGRFINAEWYNRGVVVSSFTNDPVDGNYWSAHYLGANRPWGGAAAGTSRVSASVDSAAPATSLPAVRPAPVPTGTPITVPSVRAFPTPNTLPVGVASPPHVSAVATVRVPSLNVRSKPSLHSSVVTVIRGGTSLMIVGQRRGWIHVSLRGGRAGWVVAAGIHVKGATAFRQHVVHARGSAVLTGSKTVKRPAATFRRTAVAVTATLGSVTVQVHGLRVRSTPSLTGSVLGLAATGTPLKVVRRTSSWVEIRLNSGKFGWVSREFVSAPASPRTVNRRVAAAKSVGSGEGVTRVALNVRARASRSGAIVHVLVPGDTYHIEKWSDGWAQVRLATGLTGWISGTVLPASSRANRAASSTRVAVNHVAVTTNVRVHTEPSLQSTALRLLAAGTHIGVLSESGGWAKVRLSATQTGYVAEAYISQ